MSKEHRSTSELNPWMFQHENGFIEICKDSSLLMAFEIVGMDADGSSVDDISNTLSALDNAYKQLTPYRITIQWLVHRRSVKYYPENRFQNYMSEKIDENRKQSFLSGSSFENRHYVVLKMDAPKSGSRVAERVRFFINEGESPVKALAKGVTTLFSDSQAFAYSKNELNNQIDTFLNVSESFCQIANNLNFRRLHGSEFKGFLRRCFNPNSKQENVNLSEDGSYFTDEKIPDCEVEESGNGMIRFISNNTSYGVGFSLKDIFEMSIQGALDAILTLPFDITLSHTFKMASREDAVKHCQSVRRFNMYTAYPPQSYVMAAFKGGSMEGLPANESKLIAAEVANDVMGKISINDAFYGFYNLTLIVHGNTERDAERNAEEAKSMLNYNGFTPIEERMHLISAYTSTLPGMTADVKRWHFIEIENLSDLTPFLTISSGVKKNSYLSQQTGRDCNSLALMQTQYGVPYNFNFHTGDIGHAFVVGPTRSGKSVGMNFLLSQWQKYAPCKTYIFDKDFSCRIATLMQDGTHVDLTSSKKNAIKMNPLLLLDNPKHHMWVSSFVEDLLLSRKKEEILSSDDSKAVWDAVQGVAKLDPELRRLISLVGLLPKHLRDELTQWVEGGKFGHYFDNVEDNFALSDFTAIEMGDIMGNGIVANPFMDYAFYRIKSQLEENREKTPVPTIIYIEECWFMLDDPRFSQKVKDWLKTLGKYVAAVVMATQSPEDLAQSNIFSSLRDNIPTRIFLPNAKAGSESLRDLYEKQFQLNESQIEDIINGVTKRDYFIQQPGIWRKVMMTLDRESLSVLRSDALAQNTFDKHLNSGRADWKMAYMNEMSNAF